MWKIIISWLLIISLVSGCAGAIGYSTVEYKSPLYTVSVSGTGGNASTINALGEYGVFNGAKLTIEAIQKLAPILAKCGYRARISAGEVIIEPMPRDMLVAIENRYLAKAMDVTIYTAEGNWCWGEVINPKSAKTTVLKAGNYTLKVAFVGQKPGPSIPITIPDDDHKQYSSLAGMEVDYLRYWPKY